MLYPIYLNAKEYYGPGYFKPMTLKYVSMT
ncbi:hypothetical protein Trydic_g10607, partial [Trypoxylus dichotomus]